MKKIIKRLAAASAAVILAASLCGCDKGSLMTVDGMEIRNGVYISLLKTAYSMASTELKKQNSENTSSDTSDTSASSNTSDTSEAESKPITEENIRGKDGSQWIKDEALKAVRRFVAVQRKCDELNITLTDEELSTINSEVTEIWNKENTYVQYLYGYPTMGEYYESQGIAEESYRQIQKVTTLQEKLFMHFYGKGGELEIKDSEINDYLTENYACVKLLTIKYAGTEDKDKTEAKQEAEKYAERINDGEKPADVFYDYNLAQARKSAEKKAETDYKEDNEEKLSKEDWIKKQVEAAEIKKAESEDDLLTVISKESSGLDEDVTEYIFNAEIEDKANVFEGKNGAFIVIKTDITKNTKWKEDNNDSILQLMKSEDFQSMLDLFGQNYEVVADNSLVNKKYGPEKLN